MAFLAALPEIAAVGGEAGGAAAEAGGAAAGAGASGAGGGGMLSKVGGLFKSTPPPAPGEENKQQNAGDSRNFNFQDAANSVRSAVRPDAGGVE